MCVRARAFVRAQMGGSCMYEWGQLSVGVGVSECEPGLPASPNGQFR